MMVLFEDALLKEMIDYVSAVMYPDEPAEDNMVAAAISLLLSSDDAWIEKTFTDNNTSGIGGFVMDLMSDECHFINIIDLTKNVRAKIKDTLGIDNFDNLDINRGCVLIKF